MVTGLFYKYEYVDKSILVVDDIDTILVTAYNFCNSIFIKNTCVYVDVDCFYFTNIDSGILKKFDGLNIPYKILYNNDFLFISKKKWINIDGDGKVELKNIKNDDYKKDILKRCRKKKLKNLIID
jgi:hypothetical protein